MGNCLPKLSWPMYQITDYPLPIVSSNCEFRLRRATPMTTNPNDPVDTKTTSMKREEGRDGSYTEIESSVGLTKREYFAAMAMQGLLGNSNLNESKYNVVAEVSVRMSDALIKELNKA